MPPNTLTAADVDALERRMAGASSVDSVSVDKDVLAALIEGWRCWQMVEAMPDASTLVRGVAKDATPGWYHARRTGRGFYGTTAAAALRAAREGASDAE